MKEYRVYQDGGVFYDDTTGDVIFTSSVHVSDYDIDAADRARAEFMDVMLSRGILPQQILFV